MDLAVVDPMLGQAPRSVEIARLHQHFPSLPLVIYTALTPETAGVLLDLGRVGIRRVLFERFDDAPAAHPHGCCGPSWTRAPRRC